MLDFFKKSSFFLLIGIVIFLIFILTREQDIHRDLTTTVLSSDTLSNSSHDMDFLDTEQDIQTIMVDVKGAVKKPGVYEMKLGDRVNDVIQIAGGFTEEADESFVNLAQKVQDEMIIIVPFTNTLDSDNVSDPNQNQTQSSTSGGKVRINYATQVELETLPGIGPSKAQAIIQYRDEHGYFQSVEDLIQVSGIGEKTLENMLDYIQVP